MVGLLALVISSIFFGAAFYVSVVEQPARLRLDEGGSFGSVGPGLQAGFCHASATGNDLWTVWALAWWTTGAAAWALGAVAIIANWPYTLMVIMPVNNRLLASLSRGASSETSGLIVRWGRLHAVRSVVGALATAAYLIAALQGGHVD